MRQSFQVLGRVPDPRRRAREAASFGGDFGLGSVPSCAERAACTPSASGADTRGQEVSFGVHAAADAVRVHVASGVQPVGSGKQLGACRTAGTVSH